MIFLHFLRPVISSAILSNPDNIIYMPRLRELWYSVSFFQDGCRWLHDDKGSKLPFKLPACRYLLLNFVKYSNESGLSGWRLQQNTFSDGHCAIYICKINSVCPLCIPPVFDPSGRHLRSSTTSIRRVLDDLGSWNDVIEGQAHDELLA